MMLGCVGCVRWVSGICLVDIRCFWFLFCMLNVVFVSAVVVFGSVVVVCGEMSFWFLMVGWRHLCFCELGLCGFLIGCAGRGREQ